MEMQVVYVYAATVSGALDDLPVEDAKRFVTELGEYLQTRTRRSWRRSARPASSPTRPRTS